MVDLAAEYHLKVKTDVQVSEHLHNLCSSHWNITSYRCLEKIGCVHKFTGLSNCLFISELMSFGNERVLQNIRS